jgi:hypothetical protein
MISSDIEECSAVVSVALVCESVAELVPYVYLVGAAALACS